MVPFPDDLPSNGIIVPKTAAGFLVWTDTSTAVLDFFITNPSATLMARGRAIDKIIAGLLRKAKSLGFRRVSCDSKIIAIKKKALSLGFKDLGDHQVFCKEI